MDVQEFQVSKWPTLINIPFSISWSKDDMIAMVTEKGVCVMKLTWRKAQSTFVTLLSLVLLSSCVGASDITSSVFGNEIDIIPAAFGDFNSDEYPDLFVIKNKGRTVEILLGSDTEPLFKPDVNLTCNFSHPLTSVVPGDFDGDGLLDVMVILEDSDGNNSVRILWGYLNRLKCDEGIYIYLRLRGQPLAMDHNRDTVLDLFGTSTDGERSFWIFSKNRTKPEMIEALGGKNRNLPELRNPHSHSFLDLNDDSSADLFVTTEKNFEIWLWDDDKKFCYDSTIQWPSKEVKKVGQSLFVDLGLSGRIDHILPVCFDNHCYNSSLYVYSSGKWRDLKVNFNERGKTWGFVPPEKGKLLSDAITLHIGDFNMDGYPDALATLKNGAQMKSFLLENIECPSDCEGSPRTFEVKWKALSPYNENTVLGVFYDFSQDGVLDIIFVHDKPKARMNVSAFKNSLDYDANFIKVMVLSGITNKEHPVVPTPLGRKRRTYGTSIPGPKIWYNTTTQEGGRRAAVSTQLPQSAFFSLHLPYSLFGLGRTPNFVDSLVAGVGGHNRSWPQIIPNSQMVIIPWPPTDPFRWTAQLFVTPSKLILQSVLALFGTCLVILLIIIFLYWKERREDHLEKQQEAYRFHFDAM